MQSSWEDQPEHKPDVSHLSRLWRFVYPYRWSFALTFAILTVSFSLEVLRPLLVRLAIDGPVTDAVGGGAPQTSEILWLGLAYLALTAVVVALNYAYRMASALNGQRVIRDLRQSLFEHILRLPPRFFERNPSGKLTTHVVWDVENLNQLIATGVLQTLFDLFKVVGILALLFFIDVDLALLALLTTPVILVTGVVFRSFARRSYRKVRLRLAQQNAFTSEVVGGVRMTKAFGREAEVEGHYSDLASRTAGAWSQNILHFTLFFTVVDLSLRVTQVGILYLGGIGIIEGNLSAGALVQVWLYFAKLTEPVRELGNKYNLLQNALSSTERIAAIFDEREDPPAPAHPEPSQRGPAHVRFEGVSFAYRPGFDVLRELDFEVLPGQTAAVVGPTGAGKSTLLALVSRLYDPSAGQVLLDGTDLTRLEVDSLRRRVAVVPQDVFLFTGSVLENVRLFDASISEERVVEALKLVGALDFVRALEGGLHAPVQERGATFSQGERQLLAFARAIVTRPDILLLDEATSTIDNDGEALIQRNMGKILQRRTALIVAHRLSTVADADLILVMRKGRIVERGDHASLMRQRGLYASMVALA